MIIWFDTGMNLHIDKMHDANNSFALAKYIPQGYDARYVAFKANAVVSGHTLLLTHTQVTSAGGDLIGANYWNTYTTIRRHFFMKFLCTIENSIKNYLRGTKGYNGEIKLRFRVGLSTVKWFDGYNQINECVRRTDGYCYVILDKKLQ